MADRLLFKKERLKVLGSEDLSRVGGAGTTRLERLDARWERREARRERAAEREAAAGAHEAGPLSYQGSGINGASSFG